MMVASITDDSDVPFGLVQGSGHRGGGAWYFGLVQHKGPIHPIPAASSCPMVLVSSPGYLVSTLQVVCPSLIYWALKSKSLCYAYNQKKKNRLHFYNAFVLPFDTGVPFPSEFTPSAMPFSFYSFAPWPCMILYLCTHHVWDAAGWPSSFLSCVVQLCLCFG